MTMLSYKKKASSATTGEGAAIKILSNINRYAIMKLILNAKNDYCVHELSEAMGISQSATSHQLAYLEARGAVKSIRTGKTKCYVPTNSPLTRKIFIVINSLK
ncbi:MAG: winged helix-turn-helix transcriptional regulator [Candidatus Zambryskibacteria bacterium]|nr:winged helix-turn-helix transcriptional regulator [Candidatus Zambryskibacteria bacterium]